MCDLICDVHYCTQTSKLRCGSSSRQ